MHVLVFYLILRETLLEIHCSPPSHGTDKTPVNSSINAVAVYIFYEEVFSYIGDNQFHNKQNADMSFNPESIQNANLDLARDQALGQGRG